MKIKIQYYKLNENGKYEPVKEGTEVKTKKEAKGIITKVFKLFSVKPEAIIEINDDKFTWRDFESKIVNHTYGNNIDIITLSEAKKAAVRIKK